MANPYTRLKDETDAKIASLTEQNKNLESALLGETKYSSMARQRIAQLEHALHFAQLLRSIAGEAGTYLARSWTTGKNGRAVEASLWDAIDMFKDAYERTQPKSGAFSLGLGQGLAPRSAAEFEAQHQALYAQQQKKKD